MNRPPPRKIHAGANACYLILILSKQSIFADSPLFWILSYRPNDDSLLVLSLTLDEREVSRTACRPDNPEQIYGSLIYNQLFIKNIYQFREEKWQRSYPL